MAIIIGVILAIAITLSSARIQTINVDLDKGSLQITFHLNSILTIYHFPIELLINYTAINLIIKYARLENLLLKTPTGVTWMDIHVQMGTGQDVVMDEEKKLELVYPVTILDTKNPKEQNTPDRGIAIMSFWKL